MNSNKNSILNYFKKNSNKMIDIRKNNNLIKNNEVNESKIKYKNIADSGNIKLIDNNKSLDVIEDNNKKFLYNICVNSLGDWNAVLNGYIEGKTFNETINFIEKEYSLHTCFPPKEQIFQAFKDTQFCNLKVVIIGQDPYPNVGQAMGICFSVNKGVAIPKSLNNIYKLLMKENFIKSIPKHGDLSSWCKQGVLMLNSTLTVREKEANSHSKLSNWNKFTDYVITAIDKNKDHIVYLLWGAFAIKKKELLKNNKCCIIENIHPSPLAASKGDFTGKNQFKTANEYLIKQGISPIDWCIE